MIFIINKSQSVRKCNNCGKFISHKNVSYSLNYIWEQDFHRCSKCAEKFGNLIGNKRHVFC